MAAKKRIYEGIWRNPGHLNHTEAADAVNAALRDAGEPEIGSPSTMWRIFGARHGKTERKEKTKSRATQVYFIRAGGSRVKIGYAANVTRRLVALRHPLLPALKLLGTIPGGKKEEGALHARFKEYQIAGEWFRLEGRLAEYVAELRKSK